MAVTASAEKQHLRALVEQDRLGAPPGWTPVGGEAAWCSRYRLWDVFGAAAAPLIAAKPRLVAPTIVSSTFPYNTFATGTSTETTQFDVDLARRRRRAERDRLRRAKACFRLAIHTQRLDGEATFVSQKCDPWCQPRLPELQRLVSLRCFPVFLR